MICRKKFEETHIGRGRAIDRFASAKKFSADPVFVGGSSIVPGYACSGMHINNMCCFEWTKRNITPRSFGFGAVFGQGG